MSEHTPGPWFASVIMETRNKKQVAVPIIDPDTNDETLDRRPIAICNDLRTDCWGNADLIAAAPDMLEALYMVRKYLKGENMGSVILGRIEKVIAKAENSNE